MICDLGTNILGVMSSPEFKELYKKIAKLLRSGNSVTLTGLRGLGKSSFVREYFVKQHTPHLTCVHLDTNEIPKPVDKIFYKTFLYQLLKVKSDLKDTDSLDLIKQYPDDAFLLYQEIKNEIQDFLDREPKEEVLALVLHDVDNLEGLPVQFFNSIETLRNLDRDRVVIFLVHDANVYKIFNMENSGGLYTLLNSNVIWLFLWKKHLFDRMVLHVENRIGREITEKQRELIKKCCGGHPNLSYSVAQYLLEQSIDEISIRKLLSDSTIRVRVEQILDTLSQSQIDAFTTLLSTPDPKVVTDTDFERLCNLRLVEILEDGTLHFPLKLVQVYLEDTFGLMEPDTIENPDILSDSSRIVDKSGNIYIDGIEIESNLTAREYNLLKLLLSRPNEIITREEIAQFIWGSEALEKYSDWAIDQSVSRLRSKLQDDPYNPQFIETIKGRGFKLIS